MSDGSGSMTVFGFEGHDVRTTVGPDGEPWLVAVDVCAALGLANVAMATARLAVDEKGVTTADTLGGRQEVITVSEAGLYRLVFTSRRPEAEAFQRWVTHTVLPAIRKTGSYAAPVPGSYVAALRAAADAAERAEAAEALALEQAPVVAAHERLAGTDGLLLVREAAKEVGVKEGVLRTWLLGEGWIFRRTAQCGASTYDLYAARRDHLTAVPAEVSHGLHRRCLHHTVYVRPAGLVLIARTMASRTAIAGGVTLFG